MNRNQILAIILVVLGVLMGATAQLTDLLGPKLAHAIVSLAGLSNAIVAGVLGVLTSQSGMVKDVAAMPGVDKITVNTQASQALATVATDPAQPKVGAVSDKDQATLQNIAKG